MRKVPLHRTPFRALNQRNAYAAGFTLVEVLCATAVSSILMAALATMLVSSLDAYSGQEKRTNTSVESRAGLEILNADLRSFCALPDDPKRTDDDELQRFIHLPADGTFGSDRFAFLRYAKPPQLEMSALPDVGNLRLVAYAVAFTPDVGGRSSPKLYRRLFTVDETYTRLRNHLSTSAPLLSDDDWNTLTKPPTATPSATSLASVAEPVIFQMVQFRITPMLSLLASANDATSVQGIAMMPSSSVWPVQTVPACVDVLLRVTNRATAAKLTTEKDWRGEGAYKDLLLGRPETPGDYRDDREVLTQQLRIHLPRR